MMISNVETLYMPSSTVYLTPTTRLSEPSSWYVICTLLWTIHLLTISSTSTRSKNTTPKTA